MKPTAASPSTSPASVHSSSRELEKPRVLIVEDNTATARYLRQAIARLGCETFVAHTLNEALLLQSAPPFHIVLLDSDLNGQNGLSLAKGFAGPTPLPLESHFKAPIVVALCHEPLASEEQRELSIQSVLLKPLNTPQVLEIVQRSLQSFPSQAQW